MLAYIPYMDPMGVHQWVETSDFSIGVLILCPKGHNDRLLHLTRLEPATAQMSAVAVAFKWWSNKNES